MFCTLDSASLWFVGCGTTTRVLGNRDPAQSCLKALTLVSCRVMGCVYEHGVTSPEVECTVNLSFPAPTAICFQLRRLRVYVTDGQRIACSTLLS